MNRTAAQSRTRRLCDELEGLILDLKKTKEATTTLVSAAAPTPKRLSIAWGMSEVSSAAILRSLSASSEDASPRSVRPCVGTLPSVSRVASDPAWESSTEQAPRASKPCVTAMAKECSDNPF